MLRHEHDIDPFKVSSPRIFLVRMLVFLVLGVLLVIILNRQIWAAFLANPGLNGLIIGVLLIGILLAFRQVIRLFPEIAWVNSFRLADPGLAVERPPVLLAPMAAILGDQAGRMAISSPRTMRPSARCFLMTLWARDSAAMMTAPPNADPAFRLDVVRAPENDRGGWRCVPECGWGPPRFSAGADGPRALPSSSARPSGS